jgi:ABC-type spermidine/putrescine transport system permease subunit II
MSGLSRWLGRLLVAAMVVFLLAPAVMVVVMSLSADTFMAFPPGNWGTRQYAEMFASPEWARVAFNSVKVGIPAMALSVGAATLLVLALGRSRLRGKSTVLAFASLPMMIPGVALALALYGLLARLQALDTYAGVILAHTVVCLPLALFVLWPAMQATTPDLEMAAMILGASRWRAWWDTTIRLLARPILAAAIITFVTSFDEATLVVFLSGPDTMTLPRAIFDSVSTGVDPVITAIASVLIFVTALLMVSAEGLNKRRSQP